MNVEAAVDRQLADSRRRFLLPWLGAVAAALAVAGLGLALAGGVTPPGEPLPPLPKAMTAAGFFWSGLVLFLRRQVLAPAAIATRLPAPDAAAAVRHLLAGHLVLWSAATVPAIIGVAQLLAGGDARMHLLLCAASAWVLAYLLPARARLGSQAGEALAIWERARRAS